MRCSCMHKHISKHTSTKDTTHTNKHAHQSKHLLASQRSGCKCIKSSVCDMRQKEKSASWHRWHRAEIQLITANTKPPLRRAAKTTNMSSTLAQKSKERRRRWVWRKERRRGDLNKNEKGQKKEVVENTQTHTHTQKESEKKGGG